MSILKSHVALFLSFYIKPFKTGLDINLVAQLWPVYDFSSVMVGAHTRNTITQGICGIPENNEYVIVKIPLIGMYSNQAEKIDRTPM